MNQKSNLEDAYKKLKESPHWRDDFKIEEVTNAGSIPVYRIKADDQEPATVLAIIKLNEVFQTR
ncbi:hypothetical protein HA050_06145 [Iodobacter sp. HSC-16F04]|uniref:Uncharacterized protein n=1 Tax=Iodobacter violaceini TaxID=3044271 RepID=A0ABX0KMS6_9NEIS|nr:hypothetical protein [Iodobacter violacea]NHQ85700.1 hypothetical protein [Iodobacter violacea]